MMWFIGIMLIFLCTEGVSAQDITSNLVAHYTLDNTLNDATANANTLTGINSPTFTTPGKVGTHVMHLVGASTQAARASNSASLTPSGALTLSVWVKFNTLSTDPVYHMLVGKWLETGNQRSYMFNLYPFTTSQGRFYFAISGNGSTKQEEYTDGTITVGEWVHAVMVFTPSTSVQVYINKSAQTFTTSIPASLFASTTNVSLGPSAGTPWAYWCDCDMDDVRIYNRALTATDIDALYTLGISDIAPGTAAIVPPQQNLLAWWRGTAQFTGSKYWYPLTGRFPGTLTNGTSWAASTRPRGSYEVRFDGTDDYVSIATHPALEPPQRSVLLWMKAQTGGGTYQTLLGHLHASNYFNVFYKPSPDNTIAVYASTTGGSPAIDAGGGLPVLAQTWTHIAVTYTEPTLAIYVNCQPSLSMSSAIGTLNASGSAMLMGAFGSTPGNFYGGALDDVRIYNRALSAQELCSVMRQSPPLSTLNMAFVPSAAPAAPGSLFPFFTPSP